MVKLSLANPSFVLKSPFCIDNLTELRNRIVDVKFMEQNVGYRIYNTRRTVTSDPCPILQTTTSAYSILLFTCLIYASKTAIVSTYITKLSKNTTVYTHAVVLVTYSPITVWWTRFITYISPVTAWTIYAVSIISVTDFFHTSQRTGRITWYAPVSRITSVWTISVAFITGRVNTMWRTSLNENKISK